MNTTHDIPIGRTKEEIKTREKIIKDFYAKWIAEHPEKKVFNVSLAKYSVLSSFLSMKLTKRLPAATSRRWLSLD